METQKTMEGTWTLVTPDGKRYHGPTPLKCCRSEQEDRVSKEISEKRQLDLFADLAVEKMTVDELWKTPSGECPDGNLLIEVDLKSGDTDVALVFIGDDEETLYFADDNEDVYTAWEWSSVSRYCLMEDILPSR